MRGRFIRAPKPTDVPYPCSIKTKPGHRVLFAVRRPYRSRVFYKPRLPRLFSLRGPAPVRHSGRRACLTRARGLTGKPAMLILSLSVVLLLIVVDGVFAMAGIGLVTARKARLLALAETGNPGAQAARARLKADPSRLLSHRADRGDLDRGAVRHIRRAGQPACGASSKCFPDRWDVRALDRRVGDRGHRDLGFYN